MAENSSNRHGKLYAAAVLSLSGLIIGACASAPGEPAAVYMMGMAGAATHEPKAAAPTEPPTAPVALANWTEPSGSAAHPAPDVIPLDDPPQSTLAPARQAAGPASTDATLSAPVPSTSSAPAAPVAAPVSATPPPAPASAGHEPSAAEEARAEAAPAPVRERTAPEPARADLVTAGAGVPRDRAPYSRPPYYWP